MAEAAELASGVKTETQAQPKPRSSVVPLTCPSLKLGTAVVGVCCLSQMRTPSGICQQNPAAPTASQLDSKDVPGLQDLVPWALG